MTASSEPFTRTLPSTIQEFEEERKRAMLRLLLSEQNMEHEPPDQTVDLPWLGDYVRLAFVIEAAFRERGAGWYIDTYYGPPDWKPDMGDTAPPIELVSRTARLADTLPSQPFEARRRIFLEKQLLAMETFCRILAGELIPLEEAVRRCLDIEPEWVPDEHFERGLALLDDALPPGGSLRERYLHWRERGKLPPG
ncbi:MAG: hypothetical protein ACRDIB_10675, partial [Ardenticatenaceae bacterium]